MTKLSSLFAALAALGITALVPAAQADWHSIVGDALSPLSPGLANGCFTQNNGSVKNSNCASKDAALAQWPVILDSAGNGKVLKVRTVGRNVSCFLDVVDPQGKIQRTDFYTNSNGGEFQEIQVTYNVPEQYLARFGCYIGQGNYVTGYLNS